MNGVLRRQTWTLHPADPCAIMRAGDSRGSAVRLAIRCSTRIAGFMTESYDPIVIGTGQGGSGPATRCRKAGWRVAGIDDQPYGGTCALRGCHPKKVFVGAAELMDWHRRMSARVVAPDARIDWPALMRLNPPFTQPG